MDLGGWVDEGGGGRTMAMRAGGGRMCVCSAGMRKESSVVKPGELGGSG